MRTLKRNKDTLNIRKIQVVTRSESGSGMRKLFVNVTGEQARWIKYKTCFYQKKKNKIIERTDVNGKGM